MNTTQEKYPPNQKTTLSTAGAFIYAAAAVILCALCSSFLKNTAEEAVLSLLSPLFMFAAGSFMAVLASHKKNALFYASAVLGVALSFALTLDILRSLVCLGAFFAAFFIARASERACITQTGAILAVIVIYSAFILFGFGVLCYQKYSAINLDTLGRAYDSFCNVLLRAPESVLSQMKELYATDPAYASLITDYEKTVGLLRQALPMTAYFIPSAFLYICSTGAFITVFLVLKHRRMQGLENHLGAFSVSIVTAVVYLIITVVSIFADPISPLGVTLSTVSAVPSLALALIGAAYMRQRILTSPKKRTFIILSVLVLIFMTGAVLSVLSLIGAYKSIQLYLFQRLKDKFDQNNLH